MAGEEVTECVNMKPVHHGALLFEFFWNQHFDVLKNAEDKILDVDNDNVYLHAKNQCGIFYILGCVKVTNL
jgi:hypothetical protein